MAMTVTGYNRGAKLLHWSMAVLILFMLILGWVMSGEDVPNRFMLYQLHKSVGILLLVLALVRIGWRVLYSAPPLSSAVPLMQRRLAHSVHGLLYVLMLALPMSGWALVSSSPRNIPTILFGVVPLPSLPVAKDGELSHVFGEVHEMLVAGLVVLLLAHVGAALWHHFVVRDTTMLRMLPCFTKRG